MAAMRHLQGHCPWSVPPSSGRRTWAPAIDMHVLPPPLAASNLQGELAAGPCCAPRRLAEHQPHSPHATRQRRRLRPCRITNTSDEVYRAMGKRVPDGDPEKELYVSELQVHNPELGVLENRVGKFYLEELFNDSGVDLEETAYWFHTPPGGWNTEPTKMEAAEEAPVTFPEPHHMDAEATGRVAVHTLEEGTTITGQITDCWLYHGIQVDFGADYDGLVPIPQDIWMEPGVRETLMPGELIEAVIYKVRMPGLYRWPVQLQLSQPEELAAMLPAPEAYRAPINHEWCDEQGWGPEEICEATGRVFEPANLLIPPDDADAMEAMEKAFGWDDPDSRVYLDDPMKEYMMKDAQPLISDIVSGLASQASRP